MGEREDLTFVTEPSWNQLTSGSSLVSMFSKC